MNIFDDHKITAEDLLKVIPEELLANLSQSTNIDFYTKVLHGRKMFYLLMYGILENDRLSQRTLKETFRDPVFKMLFELDPQEKVRRSSISERLSKIDPDFFRLIYEDIYKRFCETYSTVDRIKYNLVRVDSTMVSDVSGKLVDGLKLKNNKKAIKYSMAFDGTLPCDLSIFNSPQYNNENKALPEVVHAHVKQQIGHQNIYVIDRGLDSTYAMSEFKEKEITFIARLKEGRNHKELESLITEDTCLDLGNLTLLKDSRVHLYASASIEEPDGTIRRGKYKVVKDPFRLIVAESKEDGKQFWFVTNSFELSAKEIAEGYRRRWDIEVFFRFIKQELNVRHLLSLNKNGIQVMLYMTLIVAMMILIYKRENNIGYKTAKRRFTMEIRNLAIAMIVVQCGGDPEIFFKKKMKLPGTDG